MARQISSREQGAFVSRKKLSALMYAKLSSSVILDLVALKAVPQAAVNQHYLHFIQPPKVQVFQGGIFITGSLLWLISC